MVELSNGDITYGVVRPLAAEIDTRTLLTAERNRIKLVNGTQQTPNMH